MTRRKTASGWGLSPPGSAPPGGDARAMLAAAVAHHRAGRLAPAKALYERILGVQPDNVDALSLLGLIARQTGRHQQAIALIRRAIAQKPDNAGLHLDLGVALHESGDPRAAIRAYERALAIAPGHADAHRNMAIACLDLGRHDAAQAAFHAVLKARHGGRWWDAPRFDPAAAATPPVPGKPLRASTFKLRDASDQIDYLIAKGRLDPSFAEMAARYRMVLAEIAQAHGPEASATLTPSQIARIGAFYDRVVHYPDAPRVAGGAINPGLDFARIEDGYLSSPISVTTFDDILTPAALAALRAFCLEATIFFNYSGARFVGADLANGFNASLLYQIAEELKARLPRVLGEHTLTNCWVYRCRNASPGVEAHTDQGVVTFNFWITPDAANLEPGHGGLLVYAKEQPYDWDWRATNTFKYRPEVLERINAFLASAKTITVPYRENRAVLFHSNLFHKSDRVRFRDGFANRRMNVTMLFGRRPDRPHP